MWTQDSVNLRISRQKSNIFEGYRKQKELEIVHLD